MSWVIRHHPPSGAPVYWNGADFGKQGAFGSLGDAARFPSADRAETAFRGGYRPTETCCRAVELVREMRG